MPKPSMPNFHCPNCVLEKLLNFFRNHFVFVIPNIPNPLFFASMDNSRVAQWSFLFSAL
jgi:hypothetical protein